MILYDIFTIINHHNNHIYDNIYDTHILCNLQTINNNITNNNRYDNIWETIILYIL